MFVNYAFHKNLISNIGREIQFTRGKQTTHKKVGKEHKQTLFKTRHICNKKSYLKSSTSLIIREMQMKIIIRYHLTPVIMAIIKAKKKNTYWQG